MRTTQVSLLAVLVALTACVWIVAVLAARSTRHGSITEAHLGDGRIIVIEALTLGTNHIVGRKSFFAERLGPWMPRGLRNFLQPKPPQSTTRTDTDSLVVWVNAVDERTRTNVDCQGIRVEFEDERGDLWGERASGWTSFDNRFWRVAHVFSAYPRSDKTLTLRIVPWRTPSPVAVSFPNPRPVNAANWTGESLPARRRTGDLEIVLAGLSARTNGGPNRAWETPAKFWQPDWQLLADGKPAVGWRMPDWSATDPLGNHGERLGLHQPVLRYSVRFLPESTNLLSTEVVATLPNSACSATTNSLWFKTNIVQGNEIVAIGLMTATMTYFTDGHYDPKPAMNMGPTRGGAPSGWVEGSRRISPVQVQVTNGHYADRPVVYLQCRDEELGARLGLRLRDERGRLFSSTREAQGSRFGVIPFLLDVPPDVTNVVPEIVILKPVEAEFTVKTPPPR